MDFMAYIQKSNLRLNNFNKLDADNQSLYKIIYYRLLDNNDKDNVSYSLLQREFKKCLNGIAKFKRDYNII